MTDMVNIQCRPTPTLYVRAAAVVSPGIEREMEDGTIRQSEDGTTREEE